MKNIFIIAIVMGLYSVISRANARNLFRQNTANLATDTSGFTDPTDFGGLPTETGFRNTKALSFDNINVQSENKKALISILAPCNFLSIRNSSQKKQPGAV